MKGMVIRGSAGCALFVLLLGCSSANKPTSENFIKALNAYYLDHDDCLFPQGERFPYEIALGANSTQDEKQMDALTDAGLLTRVKDLTIHVERYSLNAPGKRFAPRFCYGHREVKGIVSFTPPAPRHGFTETIVTYQYMMRDVPVWAKSDALMAAFPELGKSLSASPSDQATLATVGAGWHVPE
jgi:hypothetical protein